jgi:amino acid transporter
VVSTPHDAEQPVTLPQAPPVSGLTESAPRPPSTVRVAFWILIVCAALNVFLAVLIVVSWQAQVNYGLANNPAQGLTRVHDNLIANIVLDAVFGLLYLVFAFMVRAGQNWARYTVTGVALVYLLLHVGGPFTFELVALVELVAVALLYLGRSKDYFTAVKALNATRSPR